MFQLDYTNCFTLIFSFSCKSKVKSYYQKHRSKLVFSIPYGHIKDSC